MGALLAARAGAMSRENHQPTEPLHPRCSAHCDRAVRAAAAAQPPPGTHSLARRPGRRRTGRTRGRRRRREKKRGGKTRRKGEGGLDLYWRRRGMRGRGGEPCAKGGLSAKKTPQNKKLFQFKHLLWSLSSPHGSSSGSRKEGRGDPEGGEAEAEGERPRWHSLVSPPPVAAEATAAASAPPRSGAESRLRRKARTNNLKWQRRPLRHPPLTGTAPNALRLRTARAATICAGAKGERKRAGGKVYMVLKEGERKSRGRGCTQALKWVTLGAEASWLTLLPQKRSLRLDISPSCPECSFYGA